ncbi:hypothetical protein ADICYQ_5117 [Cyclobacterium qasimii M12-11B]|uniref:Uncharacterized protein n=1 Tax=Cyclobacterium qasimii M12-11B TaxID=641524 RepID=S7V8G1_9BACT|nr:hypothetical protein ADICYQ_5117 [Cyclobacterium qasimii M12-11B]
MTNGGHQTTGLIKSESKVKAPISLMGQVCPKGKNSLIITLKTS